jgi:hypothetical protein
MYISSWKLTRLLKGMGLAAPEFFGFGFGFGFEFGVSLVPTASVDTTLMAPGRSLSFPLVNFCQNFFPASQLRQFRLITGPGLSVSPALSPCTMSFNVMGERPSMPNDIPDVPKVKEVGNNRECKTGITLHGRTTNLLPSKSLADEAKVKDKHSLKSLGLLGGPQKTKYEKVQKSGSHNAWTDKFEGMCCSYCVGGAGRLTCCSLNSNFQNTFVRLPQRVK